jgi:hypothetical protein
MLNRLTHFFSKALAPETPAARPTAELPPVDHAETAVTFPDGSAVPARANGSAEQRPRGALPLAIGVHAAGFTAAGAGISAVDAQLSGYAGKSVYKAIAKGTDFFAEGVQGSNGAAAAYGAISGFVTAVPVAILASAFAGIGFWFHAHSGDHLPVGKTLKMSAAAIVANPLLLAAAYTLGNQIPIEDFPDKIVGAVILGAPLGLAYSVYKIKQELKPNQAPNPHQAEASLV